ncbi:MAG: glutamine--fructose-6-phosphate transaminase (isomerizing) [Peptococcaceae bacterium]|jgi:glucosamine--fructose-6-phosphate aminotransferase (isomerizing)|nr:glutamine--fructose-6-phosphate transaminase (isomerizing) [Peptococcaceae bacterium]
MCGIIGYTGDRDCVGIILRGLERLEYRGYDSAGLAVLEDGRVDIRKAQGRLSNLAELVKASPVRGNIGIGHTRWATHGEPSYINAHPHADANQRLAIVHNGVIENSYTLRQGLAQKGIAFISETDTEVVAQLLGYYHTGEMLTTLYRVLPMLEGSFALAILDRERPDTIYCARKGGPLIVGRGAGGSLIASDIPAILSYSRDIFFLGEAEIGAVTPEGVSFYDSLGNPLEKTSVHIDWDIDAAEKDGYPHFMLKEIHQQPKVLEETLRHYVDMEKLAVRRERMPFTPAEAKALRRLTLIGCGTAYYAGLMGQSLIRRLARLRADCEIASEFRYSEPLIEADEAFIAISQSGETLDTVAALRLAKAAGRPVIALCNVIGSTVAREADQLMYTLAGPEIAVASTKAYSAQALTLMILALDLAHLRGHMTTAELKTALRALGEIPGQAERLLGQKERIQYFASRHFNCKKIFFIGRLEDYYLAMEAALKQKEISYIHSEAYSAGELKHGPLALIEEGALVIALATQSRVLDKTMSNLLEAKARGGKVVAVGQSPTPELLAAAEVWELPAADERFAPLLGAIPMQLFAYYMALQLGRDIDKPRNLAKSVTVE